MNLLKIKLLAIIAMVLLLSSCKDEDNSIETNETSNKTGEIVLGEKLDNPYSLKNMQKAYNLLLNQSGLKSASTSESELQPTHYYVRFLPKDTAEYNLLKSDTTLVLFSYPLDYVISEGESYHDPSIPSDQITWQYTKVPIDYVFSSITHEIIEELYVPIDLPESSDSTSSQAQQLVKFDDLLNESMLLTGNLERELQDGEANLKELFPDKWHPSATIYAWDDVLDKSIPLHGVKVSARHLLHWDNAITNKNGEAKFESFRHSVNYWIIWERAYWDIRDGSFIQAYYNGPNRKKSHWDLNITGGKSIMYATMHRAAHKQYYGDNLDIRRPTTNGKAKLCYIDENGEGICWGDWIDYGILPDIKVWGKQKGNDKTTDKIFATTTHELGHLSHWHLIGIDNYAFTGKNIYESWADAVEWALTNDEYHELGDTYGVTDAINYDCSYTNQLDWPNVSKKEYSPIFIDLIDNFNQRNSGYIGGSWHTGYNTLPNDIITGYTLSYIQNNILTNSRGYSSLKDEVKSHKIAGVTDAMIDELFLLY